MRTKIDILGVRVDNLTVGEFKEDIIDFATSKRPKTIMYANANNINITQKDKGYQEIINSADILHSDGWGIVWASKFLGTPLKEKIVVTDFFVDFCEELAKKKIRLYLLGGKPGVTEKAKEKLQQKIPSLNIVGEHHGYFYREDDKEIVNKINNCRPNILLVGMGTPKQEEWTYYNRNRLNVSLCWAVGGLFDFISGRIKRAPLWMLHCHLEWLGRLYQEPKRLWRRYLIGNSVFIFRVLKFKLRRYLYGSKCYRYCL